MRTILKQNKKSLCCLIMTVSSLVSCKLLEDFGEQVGIVQNKEGNTDPFDQGPYQVRLERKSSNIRQLQLSDKDCNKDNAKKKT